MSCDNAFVPVVELSLRSIADYWPSHPEVIIVGRGLDQRAEQRLRRIAPNVSVIPNTLSAGECGPLMAHLDPRLDAAVFYARFLLWTEQFEAFDSVLHLDADVLIRAPLDDLVASDEFTIFPESYESSNHTFFDHRCAELRAKLRADALHCDPRRANAGVFVIPRRYRRRAHFEKLQHLLSRYAPYVRWADQSIINLWMISQGISRSEDRRWNFQHRWFHDPRYGHEFGAARILHFNGLPNAERLACMQWYSERKLVSNHYGSISEERPAI